RAFVVSAPPPTALSALSLHDALPISPGGGVLAAEDLGGAHQRGRPLELLGGEQPQRVAHEHRDARRPVAGLLARAERALQPADRERVGGQAEVRLRLAATSRGEQQVDETGAGGPPYGVCR